MSLSSLTTPKRRKAVTATVEDCADAADETVVGGGDDDCDEF